MRKKIGILLFMIASVFSFAKEISLYEAAKKQTPTSIVFQQNNTYRIFTKPLFQTLLIFGDEMVEYAESGDDVRFSIAEDQNTVRIKPFEENLSTDLVVKTNQNLYYFRMNSTYGEYNPLVQFLYPQKEELRKKTREKTEEPIQKINIEEINSNYTVSKRYNWTPVQIFDDGQKTYFMMSHKLQEMPTFLVRTEDKDLAIVTFRVKETESGTKLIVIDRIFKEGVLKLGKKTVIVKNKSYI
ncbi:TrbG/VirB9 family P-type conjugative transfer protein [Fusobacterium necrophorum]|uniref:Conjugal transfer protein TrbG n=1 Tax=Fusobacterium necrophorum TaxID=859 RepID=A0A4Q2KUG5_9FUSO|nr:TrbG/VirB9 family P-type conjugative transfer protein [Fusobacterium necrophorum]RXZ68427.1 conjugal transfer protein TrbG [Fusobacterium necrophorum]